MDLTPKTSSTASWWSLFNCCRPPPVSAHGNQNNDNDSNHGDNGDTPTPTATAPVLKIVTDDDNIAFVGAKSLIQDTTPTTACSAESVNMAYVGAASSGKVVTFEDNDNNAKSDPEEDNADDCGMIYEDQMPMTTGDTQNNNAQDDTMPIIAEETRTSRAKDSTGSKCNKSKSSEQQQQQIEVTFYQFILAMMLRHVFGSWLGDMDPTSNMFNRKKKLLLTQGGEEKKEFRKTMKLRKLQFNSDNKKCEVVPQLKREDEEVGSLSEMATMDEEQHDNDWVLVSTKKSG